MLGSNGGFCSVLRVLAALAILLSTASTARAQTAFSCVFGGSVTPFCAIRRIAELAGDIAFNGRRIDAARRAGSGKPTFRFFTRWPSPVG